MPFAIIAMGFLFMHLPLVFPHFSNIFSATAEKKAFPSDQAGQFGDLVGGYVGTLFALISTVLLWKTLASQIESSKADHFAGRYYELLRLHRENIGEIKWGAEEGRAVFVRIYRRFKKIYPLVCRVADAESLQLDWKGKLNLSYCCLLFGVESDSLESVMAYTALSSSQTTRVFNALFETINGKRRPLSSGHQSRLGHYYRHLYQAVCYVDQTELPPQDKRAYIRTIRAQLSTHEQAMLLINSFSRVGDAWHGIKGVRDTNLIKTYELGKNVPPGFFPEDIQRHLETELGGKYFMG